MNWDLLEEISKFVSFNSTFISDPSVNFLTMSYNVCAATVILPGLETIHQLFQCPYSYP